MAIIIGKRTNLDAPIKVESLNGVTFTTESEAHQFVVRCEQKGQELTLSGTISAKFVRADGNTVQLVGSISDGAAVVTLAQDCYNVPGRFQLAIFNTVGDTKLCIYACVGTVQRAQSGNLIDGGDIIPDVEDLIADIQAAVQSIPPTYDALLASIAETYSASKTYAVSDYVWYDGSLYRCTTAITTAEAWTSGHWTAAVLGNDLSAVKSALIDEELIAPQMVENYMVNYTGEAIANSSYVYFESTGIGAYPALHVISSLPDGAPRICFYKANGDFISQIRSTADAAPYNYDSIIAVPDGAEIIRVSCLKSNRSIYSIKTSLKEFLRSEKGNLDELRNAIVEKTTENENKLLKLTNNIEDCTIPVYFDTYDGFLLANGAIREQTDDNKEVYTNFIPVSAGDIIYIDHATNTSGASMWFCYCVYDSTKTIIGSRVDLVSSVVQPTYTKTLIIPSGVSYIRFTYRTFGTATLDLSQYWKTLNDKIQNAESGTVEVNTTWENGTINDSGVEIPTSTYIRSDYIDLSNIGWITFSPVSGFSYLTRWYGEDKVYLPEHEGNNETTFRTTSRFFDLTNDTAKYLRIIIGRTSGTNPTTADGDKAGEIAYTLIKGQINALSEAVNIGNGTDFYNGEKIILNNFNPASYRCNISKWKDFVNFSEYSLNLNQSMEIYKDYVFLFSDGAPTVILDYNTKEIISTAIMPQQENSHYNSAQFSNIYYDSDDEFPLLFTAQCQFNLEDACLIYRVIRNNTSFTFTLINSVRINVLPTYQLSWAIDNYSKKLVCAGYFNGSYQVEENNPIIVYAWDIPSRTDIISGTQILLEPSACKAYSVIEHGTMQDIYCYNNKVFIGYQPDDGGRCVYVLDIEQNRITSKITMKNPTRELEGVCIYDGKMFVCQKDGADTAGTNPLTIWVVDFE